MDEFRHFEAIKRHREETLALVKMLYEQGQTVNPLELVKDNGYFSKGMILDKSQTTDLLESIKLVKIK